MLKLLWYQAPNLKNKMQIIIIKALKKIFQYLRLKNNLCEDIADQINERPVM